MPEKIDPSQIRVFQTKEEATGEATVAKVTLGRTVVEECDGGYRVAIINRNGRTIAYLGKENPA